MAEHTRALKRSSIFRRARGRENGFTLLEVTLAVTVLLVAMMAMSASTLRMHSLRRQNRERTVAQNAIRTACERMQAAAHRAITNPAGFAQTVVAAASPGGEVGNTFGVSELQAQEGEETVGSILVVTSETVSDADLGVELGLPRDLDGDGVVGNPNVIDHARLLPVIVRARWRGVSGNVEIVHPFYVIGY